MYSSNHITYTFQNQVYQVMFRKRLGSLGGVFLLAFTFGAFHRPIHLHHKRHEALHDSQSQKVNSSRIDKSLFFSLIECTHWSKTQFFVQIFNSEEKVNKQLTSNPKQLYIKQKVNKQLLIWLKVNKQLNYGTKCGILDQCTNNEFLKSGSWVLRRKQEFLISLLSPCPLRKYKGLEKYLLHVIKWGEMLEEGAIIPKSSTTNFQVPIKRRGRKKGIKNCPKPCLLLIKNTASLSQIVFWKSESLIESLLFGGLKE